MAELLSDESKSEEDSDVSHKNKEKIDDIYLNETEFTPREESKT